MTNRLPDAPERDDSNKTIEQQLQELMTKKLPDIEKEYETSNENLDRFALYIAGDATTVTEINDEIADKFRDFLRKK